VKNPVPELASEVAQVVSIISKLQMNIEGFENAYNIQNVESKKHYEEFTNRETSLSSPQAKRVRLE